MSLENGKCPNCGANIQVDTSQASLFCSYCGSKFEPQKAVAQFKVELSGSVKVDGVAEKDKIKSVAETYQAAGKYQDALFEWGKVFSIDPTDGDAYFNYCLCIYWFNINLRPKRIDGISRFLSTNNYATFERFYLLAKKYVTPTTKIAELDRLVTEAKSELAEFEANNREADRKRSKGCLTAILCVVGIIVLIILVVCLAT